MTEPKKSKYVEDVRQEFVNLAAGHGLNESAAGELADYLTDKIAFSFRNGVNFAKKRGFAAEAAA